MPGRYSFETGMLRLSFEGDTSLSALGALLDEALADPECPTTPGVLVDLRQSTSIGQRSGDEMRTGAGLFQERADRLSGRMSVITHAGVQYGVMRMAGAYADGMGVEVGVFETESAAVEWLAAD